MSGLLQREALRKGLKMPLEGRSLFKISVKVDTPIVVGQDEISGRRQLIPILSGTLEGESMYGEVLPGGVDCQVIRPDGICELSARYAVKLSNGDSFYVENNGIRTVPSEYIEQVKRGEFVNPDVYYFCTKPQFELFGASIQWMKEKIFICKAKRLPGQVILEYYVIE